MRQLVTVLFFIFFYNIVPIFAQDLSGISFCIDPNPGLFHQLDRLDDQEIRSINMKIARFLQSYLAAAASDTVILTNSEFIPSLSLPMLEDITDRNGVDWLFTFQFSDSDSSEKEIYLGIENRVQLHEKM